MSMPLFASAAGELDIRASMTAREYRYGESPALSVSLIPIENGAADVELKGQLIREDGVILSNFNDSIFVSESASTTRMYPFAFPEWKAGYYYVIITMKYGGDITDVRRITFSLRPYTSPYWVFGGAGAMVLLGLILIIYGRRRSS